MKNNLLIISFLMLYWSCTTNIELDNVYQQKVVVQGQISEFETAEIKLSQSVSATNDDIFPPLKNAVVSLTNSDGESELLTEEDAGIYRGNTILGETNKGYSVEISAENKVYSANTTLPNFGIDIEALTLDSLPMDAAGFTPRLLGIDFAKISADSVYLLFSIFLNGFPNQSTTFYKNENPEHQESNLPLYTFNVLATGNVIGVEVTQMEKWLYDYLKGVQDSGNKEIISGLLIGPPDNLQGNFQNGALGYFGATANRFVEITVP